MTEYRAAYRHHREELSRNPPRYAVIAGSVLELYRVEPPPAPKGRHPGIDIAELDRAFLGCLRELGEANLPALRRKLGWTEGRAISTQRRLIKRGAVKARKVGGARLMRVVGGSGG